MPKKISEILKELMKIREINMMVLSKETGVGQPVISRLMSGETIDPKTSTIKTLAKYFNITINQLIGETPLQKSSNKSILESMAKNSSVPIIGWDEIIIWPNIDFKEKKKITIDDVSRNNNLYAIYMDDDSMEPIFCENTLLIIDFDKHPTDGNYTIVKCHGQTRPIFRQMVDDGNIRYLRTLNTNSMNHKIKLLTNKDKYYGTLIQTKRYFV